MTPMTRGLVVCVVSLALCATARAQRLGGAGRDDVDEAGDGTRVSGAPEVTCTPDEKSRKAGAVAFDDTITLAADRVESKALSARGYPESLSIPKTVNGVVTMNVSFFKKKNGDKATYSLRIKKDGTVSGSLTTTEGKTKYRYLVRTKGSPEPADAEKSAAGKSAGKKGGKSKGGKAKDAPADPAVVRVDGGFVRLMTTNVALTEARVTDKAKKAKVTDIQNAAGTDWQAMKGTYMSGALSAAEYVEAATRRLDDANKEMAALLGDEIADLETAYASPTVGAFLYHNAMRAALAELEDAPKAVEADKAVYQGMLELAMLVRKPAGREPDVLKKFQELTDARVKKALPAAQWARVQKTVEGLTSYRPAPAAPAPPPIKLP
jgi:hypothetical protein